MNVSVLLTNTNFKNMKKLLLKLYFIIVSFALPMSAMANDYYVSESGNDLTGDGSSVKPWSSLEKAFSTVTADAGHVIYVKEGAYTVLNTLEPPSGTQVIGDGADKTIISSTIEVVFKIAQKKDITISNVTIDGQDISKKLLDIENSKNIRILNVDLKNGNDIGLQCWAVENLIVDGGTYTEAGGRGDNNGDKAVIGFRDITNGVLANITVNDVKAQAFRAGSSMNRVILTKCIFNGCTSSAWNGGASGSISVEWWGIDSVNDCEISYCTMNGALSLASTSPNCKSLRVHHNEIFGNYGIEMTMSNLEIDHNYFHNCMYVFANFGLTDIIKNQLMHHNVLDKISLPCTFMNYTGLLNNAKLYNNTVYVDDDAPYLNFIGPVTGLEFKNNIFVNKHNRALVGRDGQTEEYNLFQGTPAIGGHALSGDPVFVNVNGGLAGYALQTESPAINAGVSIPGITDNVSDGSPDLGAFEFGQTWGVGPSAVATSINGIVSIISPVKGSVFVEGTNVELITSAFGKNGISKVEFYQEGIKLGEASSEPYTFTLNNIQSRNYNISVRAIDLLGGIIYSKPVNIIASSTTANISAVTVSDNYNSTANVIITTNASAKDASISKVEFFEGDKLLGEQNTTPWNFIWNNVPAGDHTIKVKATDSKNGSMESKDTLITINRSMEFPIATEVPTIDGEKGNSYTGKMDSIKIHLSGAIDSKADLSARFTGEYDNENLYVFFEITDDVKNRDAGENAWDSDDIEFMIDADNSKGKLYDSNDFLYYLTYNESTTHDEWGKSTNGIKFITKTTTKGYNVEALFPWKTLGDKPDGGIIGLEINIDDDDNGGERDAQLSWNSKSVETWQDPSLFGSVRLKESTAVKDIKKDNNVKVYPNPASNYIMVEVKNLKNLTYSLTDLYGRELKKGRIVSSIEKIDLSSFKGTIFLVLKDGNGYVTSTKLVVP